MQPAGLQFRSVEIDSPNVGKGIIASAEHATRKGIWASQISYGRQIALTAVTIVTTVFLAATVVPVERSRSLAQLSFGVAVGIVGDGVDSSPGLSVEHGEILLSAVDTSGLSTPILGVVSGLDQFIGSHLIHIVTLSVLRPWSRLAHQLCASVAIKVVNHELRIVGTGTNVHAEVDTPKLCPVELIAVDEHVVGLVALRIVLRGRWVPLHEDLILTVTVYITHRTVIG